MANYTVIKFKLLLSYIVVVFGLSILCYCGNMFLVALLKVKTLQRLLFFSWLHTKENIIMNIIFLLCKHIPLNLPRCTRFEFNLLDTCGCCNLFLLLCRLTARTSVRNTEAKHLIARTIECRWLMEQYIRQSIRRKSHNSYFSAQRVVLWDCVFSLLQQLTSTRLTSASNDSVHPTQ